MKAYAIYCEYGAGCIHEEIHMICKTKKIDPAQLRSGTSQLNLISGFPKTTQTTMPTKPKKKKKKAKK